MWVLQDNEWVNIGYINAKGFASYDPGSKLKYLSNKY